MGGTANEKNTKKPNLKTLKLGKRVYNNKEFNDIIDKDFSQLIKNQRPINIERFFGLYRELFYKIQRTGNPEDRSSTSHGPKQSHWGLILESQDYLNDYIDWRDKVIEDLFENIDELEEILRNKRSTEDDQHPFYPDGTFLRSPARNANGLPIWVMQNGVKREFKNYDTYKSLKRASGREYDDSDDDVCQQLEISTLDDILDGPPISADIDINLMNWQATDLDITLEGITDYIEAEITCLEGVKTSDRSPNWTSIGDSSEGYQARYNSCQIEYTSIDIVTPGDMKEVKETIFPGETKTIKYRSNVDLNEYSLNILEGFTEEKIIKNTKKELREPIKRDVYGNWIDELGNFIYRYHDLPGVPFGLKKFRKSSYGTNMIEKISRNTDTSWWLPYEDHNWNEPHEQQMQERLWEEVLSDPTNVYYNNNIQRNGWSCSRGGVYGEPIYFIPSPIGEESGHNNMFVVKVGTDSIPLNDPNAGLFEWGVQYYLILNKDYETYNHINRVKTSINHPISNSLFQKIGQLVVPYINASVDNLRNLTINELDNLSQELDAPKELFTNNWWITMSNATRSNQKLIYPGFDYL